MRAIVLSLASTFFLRAWADVTVYMPFGSDQYGVGAPFGTAAAAAATYTGSAAYNPVVLKPPDPPAQAVRDVPIRLPTGNVAGLSKTQQGNFLGFSIELSVADRLCKCILYSTRHITMNADDGFSGEKRVSFKWIECRCPHTYDDFYVIVPTFNQPFSTSWPISAKGLVWDTSFASEATHKREPP